MPGTIHIITKRGKILHSGTLNAVALQQYR